MKKRVLALLLALSCLLSVPALASDALGWELHRSVTTLGPGTTVTQQLLWGDSKADYRREYYLSYTPNEAVQPYVAYGSTVLSTSTVTRLAQSIESQGKRVLGGANGDYFVMATGAPLGLLVTDGVVRSSSSYHYALGFDETGKAVIGKPGMQIWADFSGYHLLVGGGYNKSRTLEGGMTLFSSDFGATTKTTTAGIEVILRPVTLPEDFTFPALEKETVTIDDATGQVVDPLSAAETSPADPALTPADPALTPGSDLAGSPSDPGSTPDEPPVSTHEETRFTQASLEALSSASQTLPSAPAELKLDVPMVCVVEQVVESSSAIAIPEGCLVLSLDASSSSDFHKNELKNLQKGQEFVISVTLEEEKFANVKTAIGGYTLLLQNGQVPSGLSDSPDPRSAAGVKADGTVVLYALDGRQAGHSVGGSVKQVAKRLKELGCVDAVLFDGGGSTTFGITDATADSFAVVNKPSEGTQRAVSNGLFFVSNLTATGVPGSLYVEAAEEIVLCGGKTTLTSQLIDTGFYPMHTAPDQASYTAEGGSVEGNVVTVGKEAGEVVVTATAEVTRTEETGLATSGTVTGQTLITAVATPHVIQVYQEGTGQSVSALSLDPGQSVELTATALWRNMTLASQDECFTWTVSDGLATVDQTGKLTAGTKGGSGTLKVSAGEKTLSIPLVVGGHVNTLDTCDTTENFTSSTAQVEVDRQNVKFGSSALKVNYTAGETVVESKLAIPEGDDYFGFWMLGSPEGFSISGEFLMADGTRERKTICNVAYSGWKQLLLPLPQGAREVTALVLESPGAGSVTLDQFISANDALYDQEPPQAELSLTGSTLTAILSDNVDKAFAPSQVTLTREGKSLAFTLEGNVLTAQVGANDGKTHRYSLSVADASGNLNRIGLTTRGDSQAASPFVDTQGHWAEEYATYLYDQGVTEGYFNQVGRVFEPGKNITRGEFATMLARWKGLDLSQYESVELPFVDSEAIPAWAVGAVKALYAQGIFNGSSEASGLYAFADQPITRSQAMTMLGRVQPRGFRAETQLFDDHEDIPLWASEYIYLLAGQGVVSGFNGLVRPNDPITRGEVAKLLTTMW